MHTGLDRGGNDLDQGRFLGTEAALTDFFDALEGPLRVSFEAGGARPGSTTCWLRDSEFIDVAQPNEISAIANSARKIAESIWRLFHLGELFDASKPFGGMPPATTWSGRRQEGAITS
ncbi:MAG: hypothetical protein GY946_02605 [bacterium]|nr:hypothetical protein [bacterium]